MGGGTNSANFPTTLGAFETSESGGFITHINSTGSGLIYSTFLGRGPTIYAMTSDGTGGMIATGTCITGLRTTLTAFDTTFNGGEYDCFVTRLNSSGSQLIYSTYLGGSGNYDDGDGIVNDGSGGCYITGNTVSANFPTTANAYDTTFHGGSTVAGDCFIAHLSNTGSNLLYSTFLGGSQPEAGLGLIQDDNGGVIVAGGTSSTNFPTTTGAIDNTFNGNYDCFVAHLNLENSQLLYSTYVGGSGIDIARCIVSDGQNGVIITGDAERGFPTTSGVGDSIYNGNGDTYVTRLRLINDSTASAPDRNFPPSTYALSRNYPNPFNATTTLSYSLPKSDFVELKLFDLSGREIITLVQRNQTVGTYRLQIDGSRLASGTYFVQLQAGAFAKTQKIVLLK